MANRFGALRILKQIDDLNIRLTPSRVHLVRSKVEAERLAAEGRLNPFYAIIPERSATIEEWTARHAPSAEAAYGH